MMAQLEVAVKVKGLRYFRICLWMTRFYIFTLRMLKIFLPKPHCSGKEMSIVIDLAPTIISGGE